MENVSTIQLIDLWVQLEDAYNNENSYGGNVAEIYAFTLQPRTPGYTPNKHNSLGLMDKISAEIELNSSKSLYNILTLFKSKRECTITVDNRELDEWLLKEEFIHRVEVEIIKKNENELNPLNSHSSD